MKNKYKSPLTDYQRGWNDALMEMRKALDTAVVYPRIRDLPKKEQSPFRKFLAGQTTPAIKGVAAKDQDFFFEWDYENWKQAPNKRYWD